MREDRYKQVVFLLCAVFFLLSFLTLKITTFFKKQEIVKQLKLSEIRERLENRIDRLIDQELPVRRIIYDSEAPLSETDINFSEFEKAKHKIDRNYEIATMYFNAGNYEKALHYFEKIITDYEDYQCFYQGFNNPVVFSRIFIYRICRDFYAKDDQKLKTSAIQSISAAEGMDSLMLEAILESNSDLFTAEERFDILEVRFFFGENILSLIKASLAQKSEENFLFHYRNHDFQHVYLVRCKQNRIIVSLPEREALSEMLRNIKEEFVQNKYVVSFPLLSNNMNHELCRQKAGIRYQLTPAENFESGIRAGIRRKYYLVNLGLILIYFLLVAAVSRYVFLLRKLERTKDDFLHIVSHELNTPLAGIKLCADSIRKKTAEENTADYAERISARCSQIKGLISNLIYFNKLSDPKGNINLKSNLKSGFANVELNSLIKALCQDYARSYLKEFELICSNESWFIFTEQNILSLILANLIDNSFKHIDSDKIVIRVDYAEDHDWHLIFYSDNGKVSEDFNPADIFQKFSRGCGKDRLGLGLGLYIVYRLADLLDGRIEVEKREGLCFLLKLQRSGRE